MTRIDFVGFAGLILAADAFGSPSDAPVLLIPSAGQSRAFWHGSAQALAEAGRYAICLDLRGHGDSGHAADGAYDLAAHAADVQAVLGALPARAAVVAVGWGALAALLAVGESAPDLVSALALVDTTIWFDPQAAEQRGSGFTLADRVFADAKDILNIVAGRYPDEPPLEPDERLLQAFTRNEAGQYVWRGDPGALKTLGLHEQEARLEAAAAKIALPVTLIRGTLNQSISAEATERLAGLVRGSERAEIEGAGHYAAINREEAFNAVLLDFLERRAPREPYAYIGGSEPRILRDALGCFATGVTIVTTIGADGEPIGLTANSFTSVSLDPPLILFSLARNSASLAQFEQAGRFAVNVLHIGQQPLANRFASRQASRFDGVDWSVKSDGGSPILGSSLASFDCRTHAVHEGGDHLIFIGEVTHAWFEPRRDPLLYFRGKYRRLHFAA